MKRTCGNCAGLAIQGWEGTPRAGHWTYCWFSGLYVSSAMAACALYVSEEDAALKQQAQDEKWRPGASVPLAVTE